MPKSLEPGNPVEPARMGAYEARDVYGVSALMNEVVESPTFRSHYLVLLSALVGVPSALIGVSRSLRLPEP